MYLFILYIFRPSISSETTEKPRETTIPAHQQTTSTLPNTTINQLPFTNLGKQLVYSNDSQSFSTYRSKNQKPPDTSNTTSSRHNHFWSQLKITAEIKFKLTVVSFWSWVGIFSITIFNKFV